MALPLPAGLIPSEVAFLCEMELVTVVPRQKLDSIALLSVSSRSILRRQPNCLLLELIVSFSQGPTPNLRPPRRENIPLWLALLLKKQRRANVVAPPWLHPESLRDIIYHETKVDRTGWAPPPPPPVRADSRGTSHRLNSLGASTVLSPPFLPSCTSNAPAGALPYHWFECAEMLLAHASDDIPSSSEVRSLLRDLQEVRAAKMRSSTTQLESGVDGVMSLRGVGAMELAESRGFVTGVVDGVRKIGASTEAARREDEDAHRDNDDNDDDASDEEMRL